MCLDVVPPLAHSAPVTVPLDIPHMPPGTALPQGFCTNCVLCLKHSPLDILVTPPHLFQVFAQMFFNKLFPDMPNTWESATSYSQLLPPLSCMSLSDIQHSLPIKFIYCLSLTTRSAPRGQEFLTIWFTDTASPAPEQCLTHSR